MEDIGKYYNMRYEVFEDEHYYVCHDGRELHHVRTEKKEQDGYTQTIEVYGCADCGGCEHKARCLYKYKAEKDVGRNKVMKVNERWEELKEFSFSGAKKRYYPTAPSLFIILPAEFLQLSEIVAAFRQGRCRTVDFNTIQSGGVFPNLVLYCLYEPVFCKKQELILGISLLRDVHISV